MSVNVAQLLVRSAHAYPALPALARGERVLCTYFDLAARVSRLAAGLARRLSPNERVALVMRNCPQYVELLFACWHAGLCAVPVNAKLHPRELEFILEDCGARLCFASADLSDAVAPLQASVAGLEETIDVDSPRYAALGAGAPLPMAARAAGDPAWLFYTSGTTGRPKGVTLTQRNVMAAILDYFSDVDTAVQA